MDTDFDMIYVGEPSDETELALQVADLLARCRVQLQVSSSKTIKLPRKSRTCRKCALLTCPGSQCIYNCQNLCHGKKVDCVTKGRNPKKLEELCWKGWCTQPEGHLQ